MICVRFWPSHGGVRCPAGHSRHMQRLHWMQSWPLGASLTVRRLEKTRTRSHSNWRSRERWLAPSLRHHPTGASTGGSLPLFHCSLAVAHLLQRLAALWRAGGVSTAALCMKRSLPKLEKRRVRVLRAFQGCEYPIHRALLLLLQCIHTPPTHHGTLNTPGWRLMSDLYQALAEKCPFGSAQCVQWQFWYA